MKFEAGTEAGVNMKTFLKSLLYVSLVCLIGLVIMLFVDSSSPLVAAFMTTMFISLAIGVRGTDTIFKSFAFSLWIFAAVTLSMFYPQYMTSWGGYDLSNLIVPLIQLIMFGMGTQLSLQDFNGVFQKPKGVAIGIICQYTIMPVLGISLALLFGFPAEVAAGIVLIGSCPGGVASNVMAYIAKADLALSITLTSVSTLLSPIATPYLMQFLAGQFVPIDTFGMMISILNMIIVPIILGLLFNHFLHGKIKWLDDIMPVVSMAGIAFIIAVITAAGRDALVSIGLLLVLAGIIHNALGYLMGYWGCRLSGMDEKSCRTIAFEVGMQNAGMASGLAQAMGRLATVGLAAAIFGPWMNISGSTLANYWRRKTLKDTDDDEEPESAVNPVS